MNNINSLFLLEMGRIILKNKKKKESGLTGSFFLLSTASHSTHLSHCYYYYYYDFFLPLDEIAAESLTDFLAPPVFCWWPGEAFLNLERWLLLLRLLPACLLFFLGCCLDVGDCSGWCCKGQRSFSIRYASKMNRSGGVMWDERRKWTHINKDVKWNEKGAKKKDAHKYHSNEKKTKKNKQIE